MRKTAPTSLHRKCWNVFFFIILASGNIRQQSISYILNIWNQKCSSMSRRRKKRDLRRSISNVWMCIAIFVVSLFELSWNLRNERFSCILNIWKRKYRSRSQIRKTGLTAFDRKCMNVNWWILLFISLALCSIRKRTIFTYLNIWNRKWRSSPRRKIKFAVFDRKRLKVSYGLFS